MVVDTHAVVLAGVGGARARALVDVLVAVIALEAGRAGAGALARHLVGVAPRPGLAGVDVALVVQVAHQPRLPRRTLALVLADLVDAGAAVLALVHGAVVLVLLAVLPDEAVDADALVAALGVAAGAVVLARVVDGALVHVLEAVAAGPAGRALAGVGVDAVHAGSAVLTHVSSAVVDIDFAVGSGKS